MLLTPLGAVMGCALALVLLSTTPSKAELRIGGMMNEWSPSFCMKPTFPLFMISRGSEVSDISAYNRFVLDANSYLDCIEADAAETLKKARALIQETMERESSDVKSQAARAKSVLERAYGPLR